ncbi:hypothetical protein EVJ58_g11122, partial [Rhodofomes roseus]
MLNESDNLPDWDKDLDNLAGDLDFEDEEVLDEHTDNMEGFVDKLNKLDAEEHHVQLESVRPVKLVLFKLRKIAYMVHNSTTILALAWRKILHEKLAEKKLPCNVTTRWNSTFKMLDVTTLYCPAVAALTQDQENGLRKYKLTKREWEIATQLHDILR